MPKKVIEIINASLALNGLPPLTSGNFAHSQEAMYLQTEQWFTLRYHELLAYRLPYQAKKSSFLTEVGVASYPVELSFTDLTKADVYLMDDRGNKPLKRGYDDNIRELHPDLSTLPLGSPSFWIPLLDEDTSMWSICFDKKVDKEYKIVYTYSYTLLNSFDPELVTVCDQVGDNYLIQIIGYDLALAHGMENSAMLLSNAERSLNRLFSEYCQTPNDSPRPTFGFYQLWN